MMSAVCSAPRKTRVMCPEVDVAASIRANFAANLTTILEELRASGTLQREVAKAIGVTTQQISQWKDQISLPGPETIQKLAEIAGLADPGFLYLDPTNFAANRLKTNRQLFESVRDLSVTARRVVDLIGARGEVRKS